MKIPETFGQRMEKLKDVKVFPNPDHPDWWNRELNENAQKKYSWAAPYDARFPQVRKQRQCFAYYVDYFRCQELMGEDYKVSTNLKKNTISILILALSIFPKCI